MRELIFAVLVLALAACVSGCGMINSRGIAFNGSITGVDEAQESHVLHKNGQPIACLWDSKYCKEEAGS